MYKCANCKQQRNNGDVVFLVENIIRGITYPNCSKECANAIKLQMIEELQRKIDKMGKSEIVKEIW